MVTCGSERVNTEFSLPEPYQKSSFFSYSLLLIFIQLILSTQDLLNDSHHHLSYNSYDVGSENLVLDQQVIP